MKRLARNLVLGAATAATVLSAMPMAEARDRHRNRDHRAPIVRHQNNAGPAVAAGIIGLALGAIVIGSLSQRESDAYVRDNPYSRPRPSPDRNFFPDAPGSYADEAAYAGSLEPWSPGWYDYCADRYRSFIPATGTYTTYGGEKRFCIAE